MQAGLAATLACLQAAQHVQALSAAVLLSCSLPIAADDSYDTIAAPAPSAGAVAAAAAAAATATTPRCSQAAARSPATIRKRQRQQRDQQAPPQHDQQQDADAACHPLPVASAARREEREEREEQRRQGQARRAGKEERRQRRKQRQPEEQEEEEHARQPEQQRKQHKRQRQRPVPEQEADGHLGQQVGGAMPESPAAAEPPAAAAAAAQEADKPQGTAAAEAATGQTPHPVYRFWSPPEVERLMRCMDEPHFRRELLGSEELDWHAVAEHFKRSVQAVRSKYRHEQVTREDRANGQGQRGGSTRNSISYGYMALFGLASLPKRSGTGEEVCAAVEVHPPFQPLLDRTFRPDSTGVPKWKQRIREELSHRSYFINTRQKRAGETIWQLDSSNFDSMPPAQRKWLARQLPGLPFSSK